MYGFIKLFDFIIYKIKLKKKIALKKAIIFDFKFQKVKKVKKKKSKNQKINKV